MIAHGTRDGRTCSGRRSRAHQWEKSQRIAPRRRVRQRRQAADLVALGRERGGLGDDLPDALAAQPPAAAVRGRVVVGSCP
jgi:hypothetical protein